MIDFLWGGSAAAAAAAGLFFFRFWRETRDRLFLWFAVAFWLLATSWFLLSTMSPPAENRHYVYALRLAAFLLIIAGIVEKNRAPRA
jgi:hypothetical protein